VFVGFKRTSLVIIDLETGQIRGVVDTDTECAWPTYSEASAEHDPELDSDGPDGTKVPSPKLKEVYIGRTEYRLKIHTRPSQNNPTAKRKTQNLSFTSYHPNTFHSTSQARYKTSADGAYVQGLTGGKVLAFVVKEKDSTDPQEDMKASFKWATHLPENM
jgi:serine/threonine-protein kinase/endoribonuclease IRE1